MHFAIEVRAAPDTCGGQAARHFAEAVANSTYELKKVFFVGAGAGHADMLLRCVPDVGGEPLMWKFWQECADATGADLLLCATAAQQLRDSDNARLCPAFTICGMAELVVTPQRQTRLISFNP